MSALRRQLSFAEQNAEIRRMHDAGSTPSDMSRRLGMPTLIIRQRMAALGMTPNGADGPVEKIDPMWLTENDGYRRILIWERQRDGARKTREANGKSLPRRPSNDTFLNSLRGSA